MFAGSCIGVICLVVVLEALRRASREFDSFITRRAATSASLSVAGTRIVTDSDSDGKSTTVGHAGALPGPRSFTPSLSQQLVRSFLHMLQFAVAYFIMLLAMYFNGYIIICIVCAYRRVHLEFGSADRYIAVHWCLSGRILLQLA
jgi:solute carrier family 31 (copper transporter), member 1